MHSFQNKTALRLNMELFYSLCPFLAQKTTHVDLSFIQEFFNQAEVHPNPCINAAVAVLYENLDFGSNQVNLFTHFKVILTELQDLNVKGFLTATVKHQWWDSEFIQKKGHWLTIKGLSQQTLQLTDTFLTIAKESASPEDFEINITAVRNQLEAIALQERGIAAVCMGALAAFQGGPVNINMQNVRALLQSLIDKYQQTICTP